jgi:hypothetical protein
MLAQGPLRPDLAAVIRCLGGSCERPLPKRPPATGVLAELARHGKPQ